MESPTETDGFSETYLNFDSTYLQHMYYRAKTLVKLDNMQRTLDPCNPCDFMGEQYRLGSRNERLLTWQAY